MKIAYKTLWQCGLLCTLITACSTETYHKDIAPEPDSEIVKKQQVIADKFLAVTANQHATKAAYAVLKQGGSASDAAIAAQLVLGLVEPQSSGIGGGAFALHWNAKNQTLSSFDGRETAPQNVGTDHFLTAEGKPNGFFEAVIGGHAVGTPGVIKLLARMHQESGKLAWSELFQPAIKLAENGFLVSPRLNALLTKVPLVDKHPSMHGYFFDENGKPVATGTLLKNPAYANTLKRIAKQGETTFYQGPLATAIVEAINNDPIRPGKLSLQDLAEYQVIERKPICSTFLEYNVCGMAPPSSGGSTVLAILGMLETFADLDTQSSDFIHVFAEASRLAFADRNTYIADPKFVDVDATQLIDKTYIKKRAENISRQQAMPSALPGKPFSALSFVESHSPELPSTSHFSIIDGDGNIVSMTSSIETAFGSRIFVEGFLLNNQLTDFSFVPKNEKDEMIANRIEAGKRPRSSMAPMIVLKDQEPVLALGSPGGSRIIDYVAKALFLILNDQQDIQQAIDSPHIVHIGRELELEAGTPLMTQSEALEQLGHKLVLKPQTSGLHGFEIREGKIISGVDPRREGSALGE